MPQSLEENQLTFAELSLAPQIQSAIDEAGYEHPTPIQAKVIPQMLDGRDVIAQSQTGSGKTAAFALPILTRINTKKRKPQILVLAPTRELAIQVARSFESYGANLPKISVATIYGGQDYELQFRQLRQGAQIVVGTPGRVIDHINRGTLDLSELQCLVLDEADEMLNLGFLEDVEFVLKQTPEQRQIALFSATMPEPIQKIADRYLNHPSRIRIKKKTATADSIRQRAVFVSPRDKMEVLVRFLETEKTDGVIVFTRTRETTTQVAEQLAKAGISTVALNGEMQQRSRERTIQRLKAGQLDVLVATDIAARGLDVPRITHVFNFDLPEGTESYIHRVGRTGRAGRQGEAIIFLTPAQRGKLRFIEKATRQRIEIVERPSANEINAVRIERFKESIAKTIKEQDISFFQTLINDYAEASGHSHGQIAAAIAHMSQKGRKFQTVDRPRREDRSSRNEPFDDHSSRSSRNQFEGKARKGNARQVESGMQRYQISVGKRDGVRPGNIVGAFANEAGIAGSSIGNISIQNSFSTIDLPSELSFDIFELLKNTRVAGRLIKLKLAHPEKSTKSDFKKSKFKKAKFKNKKKSSKRSERKNAS